MSLVIGVVVLVLLFLGSQLVWRVASRRRSLPCPAWLSWMVDNPLSQHRTRRALSQLELAPGIRVLDAGCGPGRLAIPIAEAVTPGGSVLAVDIQPRMLARARQKAARVGVSNLELLEAGLGEGKLPEASFDRAVLSTVLGEIPDRVAALREIRQALVPGGFLLVNEVFGDPHYQSQARVRALAAEVGLCPGRVYGGRLAFSIVLER